MSERKKIRIEIPSGSLVFQCKCGASFAWVATANGKRMPVDLDGTPHWATCPNANDFRPVKVRA